MGETRFEDFVGIIGALNKEIQRIKNAEARRLVAGGVRELLLLGQNVAAYGLGGNINPPPPDCSPFADLLEELDRIPELLRVRFTSPYVSYFNDRLIAAIAGSRTVCHNIHLPLQSGSDAVLRAMNRQYTRAGYLEKVAAIRAALPDYSTSGICSQQVV